MPSGIKFVPKDELQKGGESDSDESNYNKKKDSKRKKEKKRGKKRYSSSESDFDSSDNKKRRKRRDKKEKNKRKRRSLDNEYSSSDEESEEDKRKNDIMRREMGLDWMLQSNNKMEKNKLPSSNEEKNKGQEEQQLEEVKRVNPKELNPYFKDDGTGYPEEDNISKGGAKLNVSSSVVGDGGASWRLKALKRAKEQAAREGKKLEEVVGERYSSLGDLAASISTSKVAPSNAHLHAIRGRKTVQLENSDQIAKKPEKRDYLRDVSSRHPEMRKPRQDDKLHWRRNKGQTSNLSTENRQLLNEAVSEINKFENDGSFLDKIRNSDNKKQKDETENKNQEESGGTCTGTSSANLVGTEGMSKNQLAARILQLRLKGKNEEADQLSKQMEAMIENPNPNSHSREESRAHSSRHNMSIKPLASERKRKEDDSDLYLAKQIMQNKKYDLSSTVDDEYDYDGNAPKKKKSKRKDEASEERAIIGKRQMMMTQKERCLFCFENPSRPKHLVVSIGNFSYLMLPQCQPVVPGHCIILPLQHEAATRNIDNNSWEEIRNFKKCLIKMFAKEEKDVVFLETVIGLSKQKRHCLVECIPIPYNLSNSAPMYFKKAIDEVEDEWEQHGAKKLILTSGNLRQAIPSNFAYFHVEFGLDQGFVHVIDNEANFSAGFGLNVIRGMLELPEEDMHRKRRHESVDRQKQAVAKFVRDWELFDWTRQL